MQAWAPMEVHSAETGVPRKMLSTINNEAFRNVAWIAFLARKRYAWEHARVLVETRAFWKPLSAPSTARTSPSSS